MTTWVLCKLIGGNSLDQVRNEKDYSFSLTHPLSFKRHHHPHELILQYKLNPIAITWSWNHKTHFVMACVAFTFGLMVKRHTEDIE